MSKKPPPKRAPIVAAAPPLFPQPYTMRLKPKVIVGTSLIPLDGVKVMDEVDVDVPALEEARMYELKNTTELSAARKDAPSRLHRFSLIYQQPKPESQRRKRGLPADLGGGGLLIGQYGSRPNTPAPLSLTSPSAKSMSNAANSNGVSSGALRTPAATTFLLQSPQAPPMQHSGSFYGNSPNASKVGGGMFPMVAESMSNYPGTAQQQAAQAAAKQKQMAKIFDGYTSSEIHLLKIAAFYKHIHGATLRVHEEISRNTGINPAEIAYVESRISAAFTALHLERQRDEASSLAATMVISGGAEEGGEFVAGGATLRRQNTMAPRRPGQKLGSEDMTARSTSPNAVGGQLPSTTRAFLKEITKRIPFDVPAVVLLILTLYCAGRDDFEALLPRDKEDTFLTSLDESSSNDPDVKRQKVRAWLLGAVKAAEKVKAAKFEEQIQQGGGAPQSSTTTANGLGQSPGSPFTPANADLTFSTTAFASVTNTPNNAASTTAFQLSRSLDELRIAMQSGATNVDEVLVKWCGTVAVLAAAVTVFTTPTPNANGAGQDPDSVPSSRPSSASESTVKLARRKRSVSVTSKHVQQRRNSPTSSVVLGTLAVGGGGSGAAVPQAITGANHSASIDLLAPSSSASTSRRRASSVRGQSPMGSTSGNPNLMGGSTTKVSGTVAPATYLSPEDLQSEQQQHSNVAGQQGGGDLSPSINGGLRGFRSSFGSTEGARIASSGEVGGGSLSPNSALKQLARGLGGSVVHVGDGQQNSSSSPRGGSIPGGSGSGNNSAITLRYRVVCPSTIAAVEHLRALTLTVWSNKFQTPLLCPMTAATDLISSELPVPIKRLFGVEPSSIISNSVEATAPERLNAIFEGWHLVMQPTAAPTTADNDPKNAKGGAAAKGKAADPKSPSATSPGKKGGKGRKKDEPVPMTPEEEAVYVANLPTHVTIEVTVRAGYTVPLRWFSNHGLENEYLVSPLLRYRIRDLDVANLRLSLYADGPNESNPLVESNVVSAVFGLLTPPPLVAGFASVSPSIGGVGDGTAKAQTPTRGISTPLQSQKPGDAQSSPNKKTPGKTTNAKLSSTQASESGSVAAQLFVPPSTATAEEAFEVVPHQFFAGVIDDARKASSVAHRMVHRLIEEFVQPHHCHRHASQRYSYFCLTCRAFICNSCAREMHVSHKVQLLKEFCQSEVTRMHPKVDALKLRIGRLREIISALGPKSSALHTLIDNGIDGVATTLERHRTALHADAAERANRQLRQILHERARCNEEQTRIAAAIDVVKTGVLKGTVPKPLASAEYFQITNQLSLTLPSHDITKLIQVLTWSNPSKYLTTTIYPPPELAVPAPMIDPRM